MADTPARLKMGLSELSIPDFIIKCTHIKSSIEDNSATFVTPNPTIATIEAGIQLLSGRQAAVQAKSGKNATFARDEAYEDLFNDMRLWANYVTGVANGVADIILLSGFGVVGGKNPVGLLDPPVKLRVQVDKKPLGSIHFSWTGVDRSSGYNVSIAPIVDGVQGEWSVPVKAKKLSHEFKNLVSGQLYAMRVSTLSSDGQGTWGQVVTYRPQ